jgi:hypothetical protein
VGHRSADRCDTAGRIAASTRFILNDFELAGFSAWQKQKVVRDLIQVKELLGATIIVFSHEMRGELRPCQPGRGALGLLAIKSKKIYRLFGEFDKFIKTRNRPKQAETAKVHEAQTQERELVLTRNSLEGGRDLFEIPIISNQGLNRDYTDLADWTDERSKQSALSVEPA